MENYHKIMTVFEGPNGVLKLEINKNTDPARIFYQILFGNEELREAMMDAMSAYAASEPDFTKFFSKMCMITSFIAKGNDCENSNSNYKKPIFSIVQGKEKN